MRVVDARVRAADKRAVAELAERRADARAENAARVQPAQRRRQITARQRRVRRVTSRAARSPVASALRRARIARLAHVRAVDARLRAADERAVDELAERRDDARAER